jgi:hypothetical protein
MAQAQNYTDISNLISQARDAFDIKAWGHPESEPRPAPKEHADHIEMHESGEDEPLPNIEPYLQVQPVSIKLPEDLRELGVQAVDHPIQYPRERTIQIPLSDDQIVQGKSMPLDSSLRWLAEICIRLLRMGHIRLKIAHGKATRLFEN